VTGPELDELLAIAREVVAETAALLTNVRPADIRTKSDPRDLVTEWDTRAEDLVRERLAARTPAIPLVGEERGGDGAHLSWLVDPIDGTVNFAHGLPIWAISIGLEVAGKIEVGVVCAPQLGWWFEASRGGGARDGTGAPLRVSAVGRLAQAMLSTGFPYDRATRPDNNFAEWDHLQRRAGACRRLGAASLDLCMVARGWIDGYWERHLKPWDTAAGVLIVAEAGGVVTNWTGGRADIYEGSVVATNGGIHQELIAELGSVRRPVT